MYPSFTVLITCSSTPYTKLVDYCANVLSFPFTTQGFQFPHTYNNGLAPDNAAQYAAISAFSTNSLRHRCCKPTAHCNKSHDPTSLLEKLRLSHKLRPTLLTWQISRCRADVPSLDIDVR